MNEDLFEYPYDSPIEELLGHMFGKCANQDTCKITPQHEIKTSGGLFILDFLIEKGKRKYAVECDGKDFHGYLPDLFRDAVLLGEGHINEMIRFRGKDLFSCPNVCMYFLAQLIPGLVDDHYLSVFEQEARSERWGKNRRGDPSGERFYENIFEVEPKDVQEEYKLWTLDVEITCRHDRFNKSLSHVRLPEWYQAFQYIQKNKITDKQLFVEKYLLRFSSEEHTESSDAPDACPF